MTEDFTDSVDYYEGSALFRAVAKIGRLRRELETANSAYEVVRQDRLNLTEKVIPNLRRELAEARGLLREARDAVEHTAKGALNLLHTETAQDLFELLTRMDKAIHADQPGVSNEIQRD